MRHCWGRQEGDPCSSSLRAPKVALMFLTRGPMHHEELWTRWLASAAGLVPADLLRFANCTDSYVAHLRNICQPPPGAGALEAQHLFTIYVHPQPEFEGGQHSWILCLPHALVWDSGGHGEAVYVAGRLYMWHAGCTRGTHMKHVAGRLYVWNPRGSPL